MLLLTLLAAGGLTVELKLEATCTGTEIELGEVAQIRGDDPLLVERAKEIELGYAPSPGYSRIFRGKRLELMLERQLEGVDVTVVGAPRTRISPETTSVSAKEITEVAKKELLRAFARLEVEYQLNGVVPDIQIPTSESGWRLRARPGAITRPTTGNFSVPVDVLIDGLPYRTIWTSWRTDVYEARPVLATSVAAGQRLTPGMFETRRVRVTKENDRNDLPPTVLTNAIASRNLAPGEAIGSKDVYRAPVVQRESIVQLCVRKGAVSAKVGAVVLEPGALGDRVRVQNVLTKEHMTAVVVSRDLVEIDLTR